MAHVTHHPHRRGLRFDISWLEHASRVRAGADGEWVMSLTFGLLVTLVGLVFVVPMVIGAFAP
jgi:hypothetical protein